MDCPVVAEHALIAHDAFALDHDVVAGFGIEIVLVLASEHHVVANDSRIEVQFRIVASRRVEPVAGLHPVVTLVAEQEVATVTAEDEVVARTAEHLLAVRSGHDEVLSLIAEDEGQPAATMDDVVALLAVQHIDFTNIRAGIGDDVIALAAMDLIDAVARFDLVIAFAAPNRVVATASHDMVVSGRTLNEDMVETIVADVLGNTVIVGIDTFDELGNRSQNRIVVHRVRVAEHHLNVLVDIQHMVRNREDVAGHCVASFAQVGVVQHHLGERVVLQLVEEVETLDAGQVVEPVRILQVLQL